MKNRYMGLAWVMLLGVSAHAGVLTPIAQSRNILASLNVSDTVQSQSAAAPGYAPFNKSFSRTGGSLYDRWTVEASQSSAIGGSTINATGAVNLAMGSSLVIDGDVRSDFSVTFKIVQPVSYTLAGNLVWDMVYDQGMTSPVVKLTGPGGLVYASPDADGYGTPLDYSSQGTLPVGVYTLEAHATAASGFAGVDSKSFVLAFSVVANGPPVVDGDRVYQVTGQLNAETLEAGDIVSRPLRPADLAAAALDLPAGTTEPGKLLAVVLSGLDGTPERLVVWDTQTGSVAAEAGDLSLQSVLADARGFAAIADTDFGSHGRFVKETDAGVTRLTLALHGTPEVPGRRGAATLVASPCTGQLNLRENAGAVRLFLIKGGSLTLGRKLGVIP